MTPIRSMTGLAMALGLGLALSACSNSTPAYAPFDPVDAPEAVTSTAQDVALTDTPAAARPAATVAAPISVRSVTVSVPKSLKVSEANRYYPGGDIVWRGDAPGDRHAQVQAIFEEAFTRGVAPLDGAQQVDLFVEVTRFHSVTEKTRYSTGGLHAITFQMTLKDAETGEIVVPLHEVKADLKAFGGQAAIEADAAGQTMKVRVTDHLSRVIYTELVTADGYQNANNGFFQVLNAI